MNVVTVEVAGEPKRWPVYLSSCSASLTVPLLPAVTARARVWRRKPLVDGLLMRSNTVSIVSWWTSFSVRITPALIGALFIAGRAKSLVVGRLYSCRRTNCDRELKVELGVVSLVDARNSE